MGACVYKSICACMQVYMCAYLDLFRSTKKQLDFGLKLKLNGKKLYPTNSLKYLGVKIGQHLTWKPQIDGILLNSTKQMHYFLKTGIL